jgi:Amt family ammonium transporter
MLRSDQTLWLLVSTVLVVLTLPGVALFYGGMVRKKNVLNTMGMPLLALALVSLEWLCFVDALAFGRSAWSLSSQLAYQTMTAALALALVTGAIVERMKVLFFLVFGILWTALVYGPLAQWLWGGGWLMNLGALDFAGGAVVHVSAGVTALVAAVLMGPRKGYGREEMKPNHLPFSFLGAGLMWVGWFGFAGGSAQAPMTTVTGAFVAIQVSAAAAALTWMAVEWLQRDKPTVLGMVSGAVAGLVAITPAAGYVGPFSAVVIGIGAGGLCYMVVNYVKLILGYDDSLDVFGMHGVGGTWGMIATGLFASTAVNPDGSDGLFYGYPYQFFAQIMTVVSVWFFAGAVTFLLIKGLALVLRPRADHEAEIAGLDLTEHGEKAYS